MNLRTTGLAAGWALVALLATGQVHAAGTAADTLIGNTATADYSIGTSPQSVSSTVEFHVDEVVAVTVTTVVTATPVTTDATPPGNSAKRVSFDVANVGNGTEDFTITIDPSLDVDPNASALGADNFDPSFFDAFIDRNDNGTFEPGTDTPFNPGADTLTLAANEVVRLVVRSNIGTLREDGVTLIADGDRGFVVVRADSDTFAVNAPQGTVEAGGGTKTGAVGPAIDAVADRAGASATAFYLVTAVNVEVAKTILDVVHPFAGSARIPGARITYRIVVDVTGSGTASNLVITDTIAAAVADQGLGYVKSSVILNSVGQSDISDGDATTVTFDVPAEGTSADALAVGGVTIAIVLGDVVVTGAAPEQFVITLVAEIL